MAKKKIAAEAEVKENTVTLDEVVAGLTLDEKISLVSGKDFWNTVEITDSPVKVPSFMFSDGPHGLRTQKGDADNLGLSESIVSVCFPSAAGLAASFDEELMRKTGETLGEECQAEGVATILGPAINIKRSPLCGRNFEYFSEDPLVAGKLSAAYINGVQSKNTGTSLKHFAVNNQEKRRFTVNAETDERTLREIYLAGFETAVKDAQPWTVMCSYNRLNGEQVSESKKILTEILRDEWGFKGLVVSDWGAVNDRVKGLEAGLDIEMPGTYGVRGKLIKEAVEAGTLDEAVLDKACRRIINLAFKWHQNRLNCEYDREEHHKRAKEIALKTQVLLKNEDSILPLDKHKKIAFIGEYAKKPRYQGGGSSHINTYKVTDAYSFAPKEAGVMYATGFGTDDIKENKELVEEALRVAKDADVAVIFAGLPESFESEGFDRHHMNLPECQTSLINKITEVQKNVVVVLHNGSPVEMPWIDSVKGVLESYLGGEAVGEAQADILFGKANPCAKLPETFPIKLADTPCYNSFPGTYNTTEYREGIFVGYRYYETAKKDVLFPFGHGLSYTTFEYSNLKLSAKEFTPETEALEVTLDVTNTGSVDGEEVVQIYVSPKTKTVFRSDIELKGFVKVALKAGETKTVSVKLCKRAFAYYNINEKDFVCDDGEYAIKAAASVADIRLEETVALTGFGVHENPYSQEITEIYSGDAREITRSQFEKLLGRTVVVEKPQPPFSWENCFADAEGMKWGTRLDKIVGFVSTKLKLDIGNSEMIYNAAMETPIRTLFAMADGIVTPDLADSLVDLISDKKGALLGAIGSAAKMGVGMLTKKKK